jgi:hydroxyacylglutathione hydrolase
LKIKQFRYSSDNLSYIIYGKDNEKEECAAIDGGATDKILDFIKKEGLDLKYVLNTHDHADHTPGNSTLLEKTGAKYISCDELSQKRFFFISGEEVLVLSTPGHTNDSITFHIKTENQDALITGDTLFNGTVGTCFTGDLDGFRISVKSLLNFPVETLIYSGHDYVKANIDFAKTIDPENNNFDTYMKSYDPQNVVSTLSDELKVNPYLRFNDPSMIDIMKARNLPVETEEERWNSIMHVY